MTQAILDYVAEPVVLDIQTPKLSDDESAALLDAINAIRSGQKQFLVLLTHEKARKDNGEYRHGKARIAGEDYDVLPGVSGATHIGWMSKAPTNKEGLVYVYVYDEARALAGERGHTNCSLADIKSFKVLSERPGPLATPEAEAPRLERQPEAAPVGPQPFTPQALMAQAMFLNAQAASLQAQAASLMAQAFMAQIQPLSSPVA